MVTVNDWLCNQGCRAKLPPPASRALMRDQSLNSSLSPLDVFENTYCRAAPRPEPQPESYEPVPPSEFQAITQKHVNNASAANILNLNSDVGTSGRSEGWVKIALHDRFDFNSDVWIRMHEHHLNINFDEELALYDFLDMDAEGEEDTEPREPMAQDILQHGHMD
ncbi:hypothetical protein BKA70DRAFT_1514908 [Coprinopsis sp. MPI-PUGE-AT-0042]|nr:hypothetical protein BKA70DRAFT_1514908 [Coprinopsis sp. MPI-PUGE-AT-0042]